MGQFRGLRTVLFAFLPILFPSRSIVILNEANDHCTPSQLHRACAAKTVLRVIRLRVVFLLH